MLNSILVLDDEVFVIVLIKPSASQGVQWAEVPWLRVEVVLWTRGKEEEVNRGRAGGGEGGEEGRVPGGGFGRRKYHRRAMMRISPGIAKRPNKFIYGNAFFT